MRPRLPMLYQFVLIPARLRARRAASALLIGLAAMTVQAAPTKGSKKPTIPPPLQSPTPPAPETVSASTPSSVPSIEAVDPASVCDRFVGGKQKTGCLQAIEAAAPDSYLAAICDKQSEPAGLLDCLHLASNYEFDPKKIQVCADPDFEDSERIACLRKAGHANSSPADPTGPAKSKKRKKIDKQG